MFLLLWNRRVGGYYTGDHLFGDDVGVQLSRQLADYLKAANVFVDVAHLSALPQEFNYLNPADLQALGQTQRADYLLGGELQHFFGSQHQHFSMYVLPLYFIGMFGWQDSKSLPWGQTTIRVYLYDGRTGDIAWRQMLEASETLPRETDSMAEAALTAFTKAAGQLATDLRQLPLDSLRTSAGP
jgi:hypothetical protein